MTPADAAPAPCMPAGTVVELLAAFAQAGLTVWVDGGWAVDALLGEPTRPHDDLDLAMFHRDVPALRALLEARGFRDVPRDDTRECNFVLGDDAGHLVDIHSFTFDAAGNNVFGVAYVPSNLTGTGTILGRPVACTNAADLVAFHAGYPLREKDFHDVRRLCARFNLPLPAPFAG